LARGVAVQIRSTPCAQMALTMRSLPRSRFWATMAPTRLAAARGCSSSLQLPAPGEPAQGRPDLYIYDLCPFSTRARMIFGLKNVPKRLIWLAYDDVATPTALVGKKMAPILHVKGEKPIGESLDIVRRIDEDPQWGPPVMQPATGREDLKAFERDLWPLMRRLLHPRFLRVYLPELAERGAKEYFIQRHPIEGPNGEPRPDLEAWMRMGEDMQAQWYDASYVNSLELIQSLNAALPSLEDLIHSEESVSPGGVGYDDVLFFCRLRHISIVKGHRLGKKTRDYVETMSRRTDIPLLASMRL